MINNPESGARKGDRSGTEESDGATGAFGEFLRGERVKEGLSLEKMAGAVHIPLRYLEALEDDDYGRLPPKPYVKGFLDALARRLSIDPKEMARRFDDGVALRDSHRKGEGRGAVFALFRPRTSPFHWRDWMIPIMLFMGVFVFSAVQYLWELGPAADSISSLEAPSGEGASAESDSQLMTENHPLLTGRLLTASGPVGVRLVIRADATTWVAVERDGGTLEEWTMRGGEAKEITAAKTMNLSLGNAGAVRLNVNGRELGYVGQKGEVKRKIVFSAPGD